MIVDVDENLDDPQLCATIACDIYNHLRASEVQILCLLRTFAILLFCLLKISVFLFVDEYVCPLTLGQEKTGYRLHGKGPKGYQCQHESNSH